MAVCSVSEVKGSRRISVFHGRNFTQLVKLQLDKNMFNRDALFKIPFWQSKISIQMGERFDGAYQKNIYIYI